MLRTDKESAKRSAKDVPENEPKYVRKCINAELSKAKRSKLTILMPNGSWRSCV
jgi:hypothetical protein